MLHAVIWKNLVGEIKSNVFKDYRTYNRFVKKIFTGEVRVLWERQYAIDRYAYETAMNAKREMGRKLVEVRSEDVC